MKLIRHANARPQKITPLKLRAKLESLASGHDIAVTATVIAIAANNFFRVDVMQNFFLKLIKKLRRLHTTETEVIAAGVNVALAARAEHVARAILVRAEERTAALHALRLVVAGIV
jgi:hypothetical protein